VQAVSRRRRQKDINSVKYRPLNGVGTMRVNALTILKVAVAVAMAAALSACTASGPSLSPDRLANNDAAGTGGKASVAVPTDVADLPDASNPSGDPLEKMNRAVFDRNQRFNHSVVYPVAKAYIDTVPESVRNSVENFAQNLTEPIVFANDILQLRVGAAVTTMGRFAMNSTVGVGGLFDVASHHDLPAQSGDFGQTLYVFGMHESPYLMVPLIGPTNLRDLVGTTVDVAATIPAGGLLPTRFATAVNNVTVAGSVTTPFTKLGQADQMQQIEETSIDAYSMLRSVVEQKRQAELQEALETSAWTASQYGVELAPESVSTASLLGPAAVATKEQDLVPSGFSRAQ
jgi:phospholipid-binding lipoprotein MlaA